MTNSGNRRKVKKRKKATSSSGTKGGIIVGLAVLAIFLGYITAKYVVGPLIGYNADSSPATIAEEGKGSEEGEKSDDEAVSGESVKLEKGYGLQFGAFSKKEAAEELSRQLKDKGIETTVIEMDNVYKVVSPIIEKKEDALKALEKLEGKDVEDVFIATFD